MIIKKPYGWLIKHFKIINLALILPMLYVMWKFKDISKFFSGYVKANYTVMENTPVEKYFTPLLYGALFVLILAYILIFWLLNSKKKNTLVYKIDIVYYILLFGSTILFYSTMYSLGTTTVVDQTIINFVKDLSFLTFLPSPVLIIYNLTKGFGFNFKSFRFDNNLDLQVGEDDDEEVELKIGTDAYIMKRNAHRLFREAKYYVLENKFVFTCILGAVGLVILWGIYMHYEVYNKNVNIYQSISMNNLSFSLKESYLTDTDIGGQIIENGCYYLAIRIGIQNLDQNNPVKVDRSMFRIYFDDKQVMPNFDRAARFSDIGVPFDGSNIPKGASKDYVLVYELSAKDVRASYQMKILSQMQQDDDKLKSSYKIINIRPINLLTQVDAGTTKVGKEIDLSGTLLGKTKLNIQEVKLKNSYQYKYKQCVGTSKSNCVMSTNSVVPSGGKALVVVKSSVIWDETTPYYLYTKKNFILDYGFIEFERNGKTVKLKIDRDVTPQAVTDVRMYEIPVTVMEGKDPRLVLTIRNQNITIKLS